TQITLTVSGLRSSGIAHEVRRGGTAIIPAGNLLNARRAPKAPPLRERMLCLAVHDPARRKAVARAVAPVAADVPPASRDVPGDVLVLRKASSVQLPVVTRGLYPYDVVEYEGV